MEPIIEFRHVRKAYGSTVVIPDLNLAIDRGEFVTMVGTSGSGKTTTLKMVNGLHMPTSGQLLIRGEDIRSRDLIQLRRHIGYAIQGSVLFPPSDSGGEHLLCAPAAGAEGQGQAAGPGGPVDGYHGAGPEPGNPDAG